MRIEYVPATAEDEAWFRELNRACYREIVARQFGSWDDDEQSRKFAAKWADQRFRRILVDGEPVGGIWVETTEDALRLREIQIHPDHQGRGIGTAALADVIAGARREGKRLWLKVLRESRAVRWYERHGFEVTGSTDAQHVMERRAVAAIRRMRPEDIETVGRIWLDASIRAHDFVPEAFWRADLAAMTTEILPHPRTEAYVFEGAGGIEGFVSLGGSRVGCLFVRPDRQGRGIGAALVDHVKRLHPELTLAVYRQNPRARRFYEREGFRVDGESTCPHTGCPEVRMSWRRGRDARADAGTGAG